MYQMEKSGAASSTGKAMSGCDKDTTNFKEIYVLETIPCQYI